MVTLLHLLQPALSCSPEDGRALCEASVTPLWHQVHHELGTDQHTSMLCSVLTQDGMLYTVLTQDGMLCTVLTACCALC